jgi:uncharacterized protein (TIGR02246 family)
MKRLSLLIGVLVALGIASAATAADLEEINKQRELWGQAFVDGNVDAIVAQYVDDATYFFSGNPFRVDGKDAIRSVLMATFAAFPTRRVVDRQPLTQIWGTTAVETGYATVTLVDRGGKATTIHGRYTVTRVKRGDRWLIVGFHSSVLPASP